MTCIPMTFSVAWAFVIVISVPTIVALVLLLRARRKTNARRRAALRVIDGQLPFRPDYSKARYDPKQYRGRP